MDPDGFLAHSHYEREITHPHLPRVSVRIRRGGGRRAPAAAAAAAAAGAGGDGVVIRRPIQKKKVLDAGFAPTQGTFPYLPSLAFLAAS